MFFNPITRQTFPFANEIDCTDTFKNLFQLDLYNNNSCYQWMLSPVPFKPPAVFAPIQIVYFQKIQRDIYRAAGLNNQLYLDSMLSPSFFIDHFKSSFGEKGYYEERARILFASFMLIKFLIDVVISILDKKNFPDKKNCRKTLLVFEKHY